MMTGFIFGGNTKVSSPQELAERRALVRAIMARTAGQTPRNIWEGLNSLSEAIGLRMEQNHLDRAEAQGFSGAENYEIPSNGPELSGLRNHPRARPPAWPGFKRI